MTDIQKIAKTLGETEADLSKIAVSQAINKWSRRKPVDSPEKEVLTDEQMHQAGYGLTVPLGVRGTNQPTVWTYSGRPTGGRQSPLRLGDFEGYSHEAPPTVRVRWDIEDQVDQRTGVNVTVTANMDAETGGVLASDLKAGETSLSDMYVGMIVRNAETKVTVFSGTSEKTIGDQNQTGVATSAMEDLESGEYEVIVLLQENKVTPAAGTGTLPTNPVTLEDGARTIYWNNKQTFYGYVMWSTHKAIDTPTTVEARGRWELEQTSEVDGLTLSGSQDPDIRRRITIRNNNVSANFSSYEPQTTSDNKSVFVCMAAWDDMTDTMDTVMVGICYRYKGQTDWRELGSQMQHEQGWLRTLMVTTGGRIVWEETIDEETDEALIRYAWTDSFGWAEGQLTYPQGRRIAAMTVSNKVRNGSTYQDYSGLQIVLEMENGKTKAYETANAQLSIKAQEGYKVYIDGYHQKYDYTIEDERETIRIQRGGATECDIDLELLGPIAL